MEILNITTYKFLPLTELSALQTALRTLAESCALRGTILLSEEGINFNLAGETTNAERFITELSKDERFADCPYKRSLSDFIPFHCLKVQLRDEIITFKQEGIAPAEHTVKHLSPKLFKQWLDEGKDMVVLDTRNTFEVEMGTFESAVQVDIEKFSDFCDAVDTLPDDAKNKPVVPFCTGGVRCEKAGPALEHLGFKEVYQLDGGILNYFSECGQSHYHGECFVFDERITITAENTL